MQKDQIIEVIEKMPDDISIGDLIAELTFREKLGKGLQEAEKGKVIKHEEVKQRLSKWLD